MNSGYVPHHISHPNKLRFVVAIRINNYFAGDYVLYAHTSKVALRRAMTIAHELNPNATSYDYTIINDTPKGGN